MMYCLSLHPTWQKKKWISIAGDGCGNYYLVVTKNDFGRGEPVIFVDTMVCDESPAYIVASSTLKFFRFLFLKELRRTGWPFDESEVESLDPATATLDGALMPWNAWAGRQPFVRAVIRSKKYDEAWSCRQLVSS